MLFVLLRRRRPPRTTRTDTLLPVPPLFRPADAHAAADDHDASHADAIANAGGTDFPVPGNHVKWTPDAPLVEGMSRVRTALEGLESESHPDDAAVAALATDIDSAVEYMFANCQLPPAPDVALHAVLARLMAHHSPPNRRASGRERVGQEV